MKKEKLTEDRRIVHEENFEALNMQFAKVFENSGIRGSKFDFHKQVVTN